MYLSHGNRQNGKKVEAFTKGFTPKQLPIIASAQVKAVKVILENKRM